MDVCNAENILEHQTLLSLTNEVFGSMSWSHSVIHQNIDYIDKDGCYYSAGITALVKVELKSGIYHQEAGYGAYTDKSKGVAVATAQKKAVTSALREALRSFGGEMAKQINQNSSHPMLDAKQTTLLQQSPISCKIPSAMKHTSPSTNTVSHIPEALSATAAAFGNTDVDNTEMKLERKRRQKQKQQEFLKQLKQKQTREDSVENRFESHLYNAQNQAQMKDNAMQNGSKTLTLDMEDALISTQEMNIMVQSASTNGISPALKNRVPLFSSPPANNYSKSTNLFGMKENKFLEDKALATNALSSRKIPLHQNNWDAHPLKRNKV